MSALVPAESRKSTMVNSFDPTNKYIGSGSRMSTLGKSIDRFSPLKRDLGGAPSTVGSSEATNIMVGTIQSAQRP